MQGQEHLGQFSRVDDAINPSDFVNLLDELLLQAGERKRRTYDMMQVKPGNRILDIGCGTGADVIALSEISGPTGLALGVDHSYTMISEARSRSRDHANPVQFEQAKAESLPFRNQTFDACRCERVLEHTEHPEMVLQEMARITKPSGRVVAYEPDWGTTVIDAPDPELTRRITVFLEQSVQSGRVGRQLRRLFQDAGLERVFVDADVWTITDFELAARLLRLEDALNSACDLGAITQAEVRDFLAWGKDANRRGRFLGSLTFFYGVGIKASSQS